MDFSYTARQCIPDNDFISSSSIDNKTDVNLWGYLCSMGNLKVCLNAIKSSDYQLQNRLLLNGETYASSSGLLQFLPSDWLSWVSIIQAIYTKNRSKVGSISGRSRFALRKCSHSFRSISDLSSHSSVHIHIHIHIHIAFDLDRSQFTFTFTFRSLLP